MHTTLLCVAVILLLHKLTSDHFHRISIKYSNTGKKKTKIVSNLKANVIRMTFINNSTNANVDGKDSELFKFNYITQRKRFSG